MTVVAVAMPMEMIGARVDLEDCLLSKKIYSFQ